MRERLTIRKNLPRVQLLEDVKLACKSFYISPIKSDDSRESLVRTLLPIQIKDLADGANQQPAGR